MCPHQPLGPKPNNNPASMFPHFHQGNGKSVKMTEPGNFQCPEQQISCLFPSNPAIPTFQLYFIGITLTRAPFPFPAPPSSLAPINFSAPLLAMASSWSGIISEPRTMLGCRSLSCGSSGDIPAHPGMGWGSGCSGHWEGFKGVCGQTQKETPQGELILPQQNHSAWRSWGRSTQEGENLGAPQPQSWCGSTTPFLWSDPCPTDGKQLHFVFNVAWNSSLQAPARSGSWDTAWKEATFGVNPDVLKEGTLSGHMGCVQALEQLLILIPAAFPAHSWMSQLHFSQRSGVSLLGIIFLG